MRDNHWFSPSQPPPQSKIAFLLSTGAEEELKTKACFIAKLCVDLWVMSIPREWLHAPLNQLSTPRRTQLVYAQAISGDENLKESF